MLFNSLIFLYFLNIIKVENKEGREKKGKTKGEVKKILEFVKMKIEKFT